MKPRKLVWTEGLFLTQHHFQQLDRYHELLLQERLNTVFPFAWGVLDLMIDEHALASGQFKVERLSAILPDGSPVLVGEQGAEDNLPARPFYEAFPAGVTSVDVYVALPQESQSTGNVEVDGNPSSYRRFIREDVAVTARQRLQDCVLHAAEVLEFVDENRVPASADDIGNVRHVLQQLTRFHKQLVEVEQIGRASCRERVYVLV